MNLDNEEEVTHFLSENVNDPEKPLLKIGTVVGCWIIKAFLGGGGFGEVYRVKHQTLSIFCALKILRENNPSNRTRFLREAEVLARQIHFGMPRFYELNEFNARPYFIMELLHPRELPIKGREIARYLCRLCAIVSALHRNGLVHRDIKPSNVLFREDGELVLIDYGLTKAIESSEAMNQCYLEITQVSQAVGTNHYAAPEQLIGEPANEGADIHSIGVLIDRCFNGRVPRLWKRIIQKATSSIPKQRFGSVNELSRAIKFRFLNDSLIVLGVLFFVMGILFFLGINKRMDIIGGSSSEMSPIENKKLNDVPKACNAGDSAIEWF